MYPTLYDLVLDLFGMDFAPFKLVQSYGMMVALGFVFGSIIITLELKRKEKIGELQSTFKKVWKGKKSSVGDKATSAL
ncbi:MAG: hypothetical protein JKX84_06045, partial [Flavobacteriales bacterium]|nr:hypothetical protein [Flavobacteriales bacterium]